jgi:hypothetical protein
MTPAHERQIVRMVGEIMREIGVLLLVFAPLDAILARDALTLWGITAIVVWAVFLIILGIAAGLKG